MRLKNHTDISDEWIRACIRAVRPAGISNFDVRVSNLKGWGCVGRAYSEGSAYHDRADPFIVVRLAPVKTFRRYSYPAHGGYLPHTWGSRKEALLFVIAHELRHLWQANHSRGKVWGAKGRYSERDADAFALSMLRRYRRGELPGLV
jgi:hypothetical protein